MKPISQEDLEWFRSTFHPIPKPELPDDAVEYSLHYIPSSYVGAIDKVAQTRSRLVEVQRTAAELTKKLLKGYIWQREGFKLEITKVEGATALYGRTDYGDSIEDEWVIVYMLRELTKRHRDIWARVVDDDGEFLLVEAAGVLPKWVEPNIAENRVWINQGDLVIIKPKQDKTKRVIEKISLLESIQIVEGEPTRLMRSPVIQEEAFYRLRNYPEQIDENLHSALVTIPRKIAYLLHKKPGYISAAVEAFYLRDPIALRPLRASNADNLSFKPENFVTVSVRFTRVGYAQLKGQDFPAPRYWVKELPSRTDQKAYSRADIGMKLTCGFEMLLSDPQNQDKTSTREIRLLLEDIEVGEEELPKDQDIEKWDNREDDEKWLDIKFEDLDRELKGKSRDKGNGRGPGLFGDSNAQQNLQRIVARFEEFMNDKSAGFDGAEFIDDFDTDSDADDDDEDEASSEGEDKEASFNEEEFSQMMKGMMGMPATAQGGRDPKILGSRNRIEELNTDTESDAEEIKQMSRQIEAELKGTGVLDLNPLQAESKGRHAVSDERSRSSLRVRGSQDTRDKHAHVDFARSLLESLQGQEGMPGPASAMLSMMNLPIPKVEREESPD